MKHILSHFTVRNKSRQIAFIRNVVLTKIICLKIILFLTFCLITGVLDFLLIGSVSSLTNVLVDADDIDVTFTFFLSVSNQPYTLLLISIAIAALSFLTKSVSLYLQSILCFGMASNISCYMHQQCIGKNPIFYSEYQSSDLISYVTMKVSHLTFNVLNPLLNICSIIMISSPIILALAYSFTIQLLQAILISAVIIYFSRRLIGGIIKKNAVLLNKIMGELGSVLVEDFHNFHIIGLSGIAHKFNFRFSQIDQRFRQLQAFNQFIGALPKSIYEFVILAFALIFLFRAQSAPVEEVLVVSSALGLAAQRLIPNLNSLNSSIIVFTGNVYFIQEFWKFIENITKAEFRLIGTNVNNALEKEIYQVRTNSFLNGSQNSIEDVEKIVLENVSFTWNTKSNKRHSIFINQEILKDELTGLIGPSGSGKSTAGLILSGLLSPTTGNVFFEGERLIESSYQEYRSKVFLCPQKPFIFNGSLLDNVVCRIDDEHIREKDAIEAVKQVFLYDELGMDMNMELSEDGRNISGGQRVRLGIARALYANKQVIIFDEPTAGLNKVLARQIGSIIMNNFVGKYRIVITHDAEMIKLMDKVVDLGVRDIFHQ